MKKSSLPFQVAHAVLRHSSPLLAGHKYCKRIAGALLSLSLLALLCGCGGEDSFELAGSYEVDDVNLLAKTIEVGESTRVEVFFQTKLESNGDPDGVEVVVRFPASVEYVDGSSRLYDNSTDDTDSISPFDIVTCENGDTYILYAFHDDDLENRELADSEFDYGLRLEVRGVSAADSVTIEAAAGEAQEFSCETDFSEEKNESLKVQ